MAIWHQAGCCCGAIDPCQYCAEGSTPSTIYVTFSGVKDCGGEANFDATQLNGSWTLPQNPGQPCDYHDFYRYTGGCGRSHQFTIDAKMFNDAGTVRFVVFVYDLCGAAGCGTALYFFNNNEAIVDDDCQNLPSPLSNECQLGDCGDVGWPLPADPGAFVEGYDGSVVVST